MAITAPRQECNQRWLEAGLIVSEGHGFLAKRSEQDLCIFNDYILRRYKSTYIVQIDRVKDLGVEVLRYFVFNANLGPCPF